MTLFLRVLGGVDLRDEEEGRRLLSIVAQPRRVVLLAYLVLAGVREPVARTRLLGLFWPDSAEDRARNALSQALHVLRRALGPGVLVSEPDDRISVDFGKLRCDALRFDAHLDDDEPEAALRFYRGPLLDGLESSGGVRFERWLELERDRYRRRAAEACVALVEARLSEGAFEEALRWARRGVRIAPLSEAVARALMRAQAARGDPNGALRTHAALERRLARELASEPSGETTELVRAIREGDARPARPGSADATERREERGAVPPTRPGVSDRSPGPFAVPIHMLASPRGLALLVAGSLALAAGVATLPDERGAAVGARPGGASVRVLPFTNESRSAAFEELARIATDWTVVRLRETGLSERPLDPAATVVGAIRERSDSAVVRAAILDRRSGDTLRTVPPATAPAGAPLDAVSLVANGVAGAVATVADPRLARWTRHASLPPTFEAYRRFSEGLEAFASGDYASSAEAFREAAMAAPDYTLPRIWEARARWRAGEREAAESLVDSLAAYRDEMLPFDRALLDFETAFVRSSWEDAYRASARMTALAPGSGWGYAQALTALYSGRIDESFAMFDTLDLRRGWLRGWSEPALTLGHMRHWQGRHDEELAALAPSGDYRDLDLVRRSWRLDALGATGEVAAAREEVAHMIAVEPDTAYGPAAELLWTRRIIHELEAHGHRAAADSFRAEWLDLARRTWDPATSRFAIGVVYAWQLLWAGEVERADSVRVRLAPERDFHRLNLLGLRGHIAAARGDESEALAVADRLASEHAEGTRYYPVSLTFRGGIRSLLRHDDEALALLERARPAYRNQYGFTPLWWYHVIHRSPRFWRFAGHPRFEAVLRDYAVLEGDTAPPGRR